MDSRRLPSNSDRRVDVDLRTLPALVSGLRLLSTRALLCHQEGLQAEFDRLAGDLAARAGVPGLMAVVGNGEAWFQACEAIAGAAEFSWYVERDGSVSGEGAMTLVVDGEPYRVGEGLRTDTPDVAAIVEAAESQCGVGTAKRPPVTGWGPYRRPEPPEGEGAAPAP